MSMFKHNLTLLLVEQFIKEKNADIFVTCDTTKDVLNLLKTYQAPDTRYGLDWTKKDEENRQSLI